MSSLDELQRSVNECVVAASDRMDRDAATIASLQEKLRLWAYYAGTLEGLIATHAPDIEMPEPPQ